MPAHARKAPPMDLLPGILTVAAGSCVFGLIIGYCAAAMNHAHHHGKRGHG